MLRGVTGDRVSPGDVKILSSGDVCVCFAFRCFDGGNYAHKSYLDGNKIVCRLDTRGLLWHFVMDPQTTFEIFCSQFSTQYSFIC